MSAYLQPFLLFLSQHAILDHFGLDGYTGETFESQPYVAVEFALGLDSPHSEGRLDSHAPLALKICRRTTESTAQQKQTKNTYKTQVHW